MKRTQILRSSILFAAFALAFPPALRAAPTTYPSADAAASALVASVEAHDPAAVAKVLGPDWKTYIPTDDIDREDVDAFLAAYKETHKLVEDKGVQHLVVGKADWSLPIPIVKRGDAWTFDLNGAREEMRVRQIGRNELDTQQAILAYYDAQRDYAINDHNGDGIHEYAQQVISTPGKQDGLYWDVKEGEPPSPLGPLFADAAKPKQGGSGYHGYHYRILTAQGPSAPGGAYDYIVGGRMRNGFAAIAWPSKYGETGVMTFMVSHDGIVFEKDLGKDTATAAAAMKKFDPDDSWHEDKDLDQQ